MTPPAMLLCFFLCLAAYQLRTSQAQYIVHSSPLAYPHPAVLANANAEAQLAPELRRSQHFYGHPKVAAGLAKASWYGYKERQVLDRETDRIPRERIYHILHNAGLSHR